MVVMIEIDYQYCYQGQAFVPELSQFQHWYNQTLKQLCLVGQYELVLRVVENTEITDLNATYRDKDKKTNVLSFPFDNEHNVPMPVELLGDIVIAADVVAGEAKAQHKTQEAHWAHISIHGLLHLLGYDHQVDAEAETMENLEIQILQQLGFDNPYQSDN